MNTEQIKNPNDIKTKDDALDQSLALNRVTMKLLKDRAAECKRLWVALVISIVVNLCIVGGFLWYESQWEYTTTETTTVTQDTGEGSGNNVYQSGENATYTQKNPEEVTSDGETDNNNNQNNHTDTK